MTGESDDRMSEGIDMTMRNKELLTKSYNDPMRSGALAMSGMMMTESRRLGLLAHSGGGGGLCGSITKPLYRKDGFDPSFKAPDVF
jgi:hypothetical protein